MEQGYQNGSVSPRNGGNSALSGDDLKFQDGAVAITGLSANAGKTFFPHSMNAAQAASSTKSPRTR